MCFPVKPLCSYMAGYQRHGGRVKELKVPREYSHLYKMFCLLSKPCVNLFHSFPMFPLLFFLLPSLFPYSLLTPQCCFFCFTTLNSVATEYWGWCSLAPGLLCTISWEADFRKQTSVSENFLCESFHKLKSSPKTILTVKERIWIELA